MIISPTLYPRILALPLAFRRLLAETEGPGWWISVPIDGAILGWFNKGSDEIFEPSVKLDSGWSWLPSDPTAWLRCACEYAQADYWAMACDGCAIMFPFSEDPDRSGDDPVSLACQVVEEYERRKA